MAQLAQRREDGRREWERLKEECQQREEEYRREEVKYRREWKRREEERQRREEAHCLEYRRDWEEDRTLMAQILERNAQKAELLHQLARKEKEKVLAAVTHAQEERMAQQL